MSEQNKANYRRLIEQGHNAGNETVMRELITPDTRLTTATETIGGATGYLHYFAQYRQAFPDLRITVDQLFAEGDQVAASWSMEGTHQGPLDGLPASGEQIKVTGANLVRFEGERVAETTIYGNMLLMMQQIGAIQLPVKEE